MTGSTKLMSKDWIICPPGSEITVTGVKVSSAATAELTGPNSAGAIASVRHANRRELYIASSVLLLPPAQWGAKTLCGNMAQVNLRLNRVLLNKHSVTFRYCRRNKNRHCELAPDFFTSADHLVSSRSMSVAYS